MKKSAGTLQEITTTLGPDEVLAQAKDFFTRHNGVYSAFTDREGPTYVTFRGQGTEEIVIAVEPKDGATRVTGSTYLYDMQISRFFAMLPTPASAASPAPKVLVAAGQSAAQEETR
jgi:hypothetical protein